MFELLTENNISFPDGFLWGTGTAGHQIEGNNIHSQRWNEELADRVRYPEVSAEACGSWERFRRDARLAAECGSQVYRFSVEWARIEPKEGHFNAAALNRYLELMRDLQKRGIRRMVTLHHFTHPAWFEAKGGFGRRENTACFLRYLEYLVPRIAEFTDGWVVFNEFNGDLIPAENKANFLYAQADAARLIRSFSPAPVGIAHAYTPFVPEEPDDEFDRMECERRDWAANRFFFHAIRTGEVVIPGREAELVDGLKDSCDFWGINYYTRHYISARHPGAFRPRPACDRLKMIRSDFYLEECCPEYLLRGLLTLRDKPVWITENGCACNDDRLRILYLARHFSAVSEAIRRGVNVRGFLVWSLMDNYEWGSYEPRFGLFSIDRTTFEAQAKPSASFFRETVERNSISAEMILKYVPEWKDFSIYS